MGRFSHNGKERQGESIGLYGGSKPYKREEPCNS